MEAAAVFLEQVDEALEFVPVLALDAADVPLHAEVAEQRGDGTEGQVVGAGGGVRGSRPDVAAHQLRRDDGPGPALDGLPFQGVVAVRAPDAVRAFQDPQVHAGAA